MLSVFVGLLSLCCLFVMTRGDLWSQSWKTLLVQLAKYAEANI
jgi:hypothetical protein